MKITVEQLRKLIREQVRKTLKESGQNDGRKEFFGKDSNIFDAKIKERKLSVPEQHQLKIAYKTLKMNPAMIGVMGGMSREEAVEVIKKLTGKTVKESVVKKEASKDNIESFMVPSGYDVGDKKVFSTTFFKLKVKRVGDIFLWRKETWKLLADVGRHEFTAERIK